MEELGASLVEPARLNEIGRRTGLGRQRAEDGGDDDQKKGRDPAPLGVHDVLYGSLVLRSRMIRAVSARGAARKPHA